MKFSLHLLTDFLWSLRHLNPYSVPKRHPALIDSVKGATSDLSSHFKAHSMTLWNSERFKESSSGLVPFTLICNYAKIGPLTLCWTFLDSCRSAHSQKHGGTRNNSALKEGDPGHPLQLRVFFVPRRGRHRQLEKIASCSGGCCSWEWDTRGPRSKLAA